MGVALLSIDVSFALVDLACRRDVPELNDHPDAVLARMLGGLRTTQSQPSPGAGPKPFPGACFPESAGHRPRRGGLQNARGARDNMASLQEEHQKYFYEIIDAWLAAEKERQAF